MNRYDHPLQRPVAARGEPAAAGRRATGVRGAASAVLLAASLAAHADGVTLSPMECGVAGQVAYAAAVVRDSGGVEMEEHQKIDHYVDNYPRRDLWRLTHNIVAWTYQNREVSPHELGTGILENCTENGGKLTFVELESM
jgi:hypothetical protein